MIDINLGNLHLEVIGKEPDGFPHRAEAGTPWRLKQRGWCGRAWKEKSGCSEICQTNHFLIASKAYCSVCELPSSPSSSEGIQFGEQYEELSKCVQKWPNQKPTRLEIKHVWHSFECNIAGGAYICITRQILKMNVCGVTPSL